MSDQENPFLRRITHTARYGETGHWHSTLECGHLVWTAMEPPTAELYCSECLHRYLAKEERHD